MNCWHIDFETFSLADLKKVGTYRYAEDESTEILLAAVAKGDDPPLVWDSTCPESRESIAALELLDDLSGSTWPVYAHNAHMEIAVARSLWRDTFGCLKPKLERWRCTQAMARRAAMPSDLGELSGALISEKLAYESRKKGKDAVGKKLINIFCSPITTGKRKGQRHYGDSEELVTFQGAKIKVSEAWQMFREYNRKDVVQEQKVLRSLLPFDLKGPALETFQFDLRMNFRGFPVNRDALKKAWKIVNDASAVDIARCNEICGLNPTQVTKLLPWLRERGYPEHDLQEASMDAALAEPDCMEPAALEVLQIRSRVAFSAVKKIPTMLRAACEDGRVRGGLLWSGAVRTHRWTGKIVQPQNFKRPSIDNTHQAYDDICAGWDSDLIQMFHGNPVEAVASCIRHFIHDEECDFFDADYKNIEARITPWMAGQENLVQAYRDGRDPYSELAALIYGKPQAIPTPKECAAGDTAAFKARYSLIEKDERFVGKQGILACGFQVGGEKFQAMCARYGQHLDMELCDRTVEVYREQNHMVASMWKALNNAAINAINNPDMTYRVRGKITFGMARTLPYPALFMQLPSGHKLVYPYPKLRRIWIFRKHKFTTKVEAEAAFKAVKEKGKLKEKDRVWETTQITFYGPDPITHQWGRQDTYGGKLLENAVQACAGDFMSHGMVIAEREGFETFLTVHDQALAKATPGKTKEEFAAALCSLPVWAKGFPLEASCDVTRFYTKD